MTEPKLGRKPINIDKPQLEKLMSYRPSLHDVAGFFKCARETVYRFIKKEYDLEFLEFRKLYGAEAKLSLVQLAMQKAQRGDNEMLKFCLINLNGWTNGQARDVRFDEDEFVDEIEWVE